MFRYDRLEERIKATGKKKVYLCEKLQRAPTYLRDAKKQNTNIKGVDLQILADELNTTAEYLTGESDEKEKSPTPEGVRLSQARIQEMLGDMTVDDLNELLSNVALEIAKKRGSK